MTIRIENRNGQLVGVDSNGNEVPIELGDVVSDSVVTDNLIINSTLYNHDGTIDVTSTSSVTYTVNGSYPEVVLLGDTAASIGFDQLQVNGDTGTNYNSLDNSDTKTTGQSQFPIPRLQDRVLLTIRDVGAAVRFGAPLAIAASGFAIAGTNSNIGGSGINQFTLSDELSNARSAKIQVYGRDLA